MSIFLIKYLLKSSGSRPGDAKWTVEYIPYWIYLKRLRKKTRKSKEDL